MKTNLIIGAALLCLIATPSLVPAAHSQSIEVASESGLASISLPQGSLRFGAKDIPVQISDVLQSLVKAGGPAIRRGKTELLGWAGKNYNKASIGDYKELIADAVKRAGWQYEEGESLDGTPGATLVSLVKIGPPRRGIIGFWYPTDDALLLAWTEMIPSVAASASASGSKTKSAAVVRPLGTTPVRAASPGAISGQAPLTFEVAGGSGRHIVNVMKNARPKQPNFPALAPKKGFVRGYAKDTSGRPLVGATIGVRSSAAGGFYSGANGKTDAKGYYEIRVPWGAAEFYNSAYTTGWGDGRGAFGLAPADGEASSFASANGLVENWVLVPYGIADPDDASDQPQYFGNYFGGSFTVGYYASDPRFGNDGGLPEGAEIDLTLIPTGPLLDGSKGRTIVFRQQVREGIALGFYAVNIPVGQYRIVALLHHNGSTSPLKMQESGPKGSMPFGLEPKSATESAVLTFRPGGAKSTNVAPGKSNWDTLAITLKP
jgi:hypothetical protein